MAALVDELDNIRFEVRDVESLREHYPLTLRRWVAKLEAHRERAVALVGAERQRAWSLYMLASAHAFANGEIGVYQVVSARGGGAHGLPLDRSAMLRRDAGVTGRA